MLPPPPRAPARRRRQSGTHEMPERAFFKLRCKPGTESEYVERHKNVWPAVQADLEAAGVLEMSIWMKGCEIYLMMVATDYKKATAFLDQQPESLKWEEYMAPMMETGEGGEYDPANAYPDGLPEVFRWEAGAGSSKRRRPAAAATPPNLQLVYFEVRAKAEALRMCLAHGNIPYKEETVASYFGKPWSEAKKEAPFGQLPLLVVDGKVLAQSGSQVRYVASLSNLIPADPFQQAFCDSVFEAAQELNSGNPIVNVFRGEQFLRKKEEYFIMFGPKLANIAQLLDSSTGPFFLGEQPYYCDFAVYHQLDISRLLTPGCVDAYPKVSAFLVAVEVRTRCAALANRHLYPHTQQNNGIQP